MYHVQYYGLMIPRGVNHGQYTCLEAIQSNVGERQGNINLTWAWFVLWNKWTQTGMSGSQDGEQLNYNVSHHLCRALQFIISQPDTKLRNRNQRIQSSNVRQPVNGRHGRTHCSPEPCQPVHKWEVSLAVDHTPRAGGQIGKKPLSRLKAQIPY